MVHCTIAAIKWIKRGRMRLGRIGLGRVGWTPFSTRLDPSLTFFPLCRDYRAVTIVPWLSCRLLCTSFYNMNSSNRLCFHSISCQKKMIIIMKLWCRIQVTTTDIFFESVVEPLITKKESRVRQNKCNHLSYK